MLQPLSLKQVSQDLYVKNHYFICDDPNNERTYSASKVQDIVMHCDHLAGDVATCKESIENIVKECRQGFHTLDSVMEVLLNLQEVLE